MKLFKPTLLVALSAVTLGAFAQTGGSGQLKSDVNKLTIDLKADVANSDVTQTELQALQGSFEAIVAIAHKPNPAAVTNLKNVVKAARADGTITAAEKKEISAAIAAVVASSGVPASDVTAFETDLKAVYVSSNFTKAQLRQLLGDLKAIFNDLPDPIGHP